MRHYYTTEITFTTADEGENPYSQDTIGSLYSEHNGLVEAMGWMEFQKRKVRGTLLYAEIKHCMESDFDTHCAIVWSRKYS